MVMEGQGQGDLEGESVAQAGPPVNGRPVQKRKRPDKATMVAPTS